MKIVIIGDGKVGHKLTIQLSEENYDVVLIDQNEGKLKEALNLHYRRWCRCESAERSRSAGR